MEGEPDLGPDSIPSAMTARGQGRGAADRWSGATDYERYVGRWSRLVAAAFVAWLDEPPGLAWLDVGCGTGALSATILQVASPSRLIGVDPSAAFLEAARASIGDPRARFLLASAEALPVPDASVEVAVSGLVMNFVPDVAAALREQVRVTRAGGRVAAYVWDYVDGMQLMRAFWDAAVELDPSGAPRDEGMRFPIAQPGPLADAWRKTGLGDVAVEPIDVPTLFRDFDDYWSPFLSGVGPAPGYAMSLSEDARMRLRERIRETLPIAPDGSIPLTARAWAVRGRRH
jgi:SAM-dependent methyltransferase